MSRKAYMQPMITRSGLRNRIRQDAALTSVKTMELPATTVANAPLARRTVPLVILTVSPIEACDLLEDELACVCRTDWAALPYGRV